jgi:dual specificity phosphatase 12
MSLIFNEPISLYLGNQNDAVAASTNEYDLVISAGGEPPLNQRKENLCVIQLNDSEDADLFDVLPTVLVALKSCPTPVEGSKKILIHCLNGYSRSVAITLALLILACNCDFDNLISFIRFCHPTSMPNAGFLQQLRLLHAIKANPQAKGRARFHRLVLNSFAISTPSPSFLLFNDKIPDALTKDEGESFRSFLESSWNFEYLDLATYENLFSHRSNQASVTYSCGSCCKQRLFTSENILIDSSVLPNASYLSIEPMEWMGDVSSLAASGRLNCPNCHNKIGSFSLERIELSSFRITLSKVIKRFE